MKNAILSIVTLAMIALFTYSTPYTEEGAIYAPTPGKIEFVGDAGSPSVFTFQEWEITKVELPAGKVEDIAVEVEINITSLRSQSKNMTNSVRKKESYFYSKRFPKATVKINGAEAISDTEYKTNALLTLKGIEKEVELIFTIEGNHVVGSGVVMRRAFNFTDDGPKDEVPVTFDIYLPL